MRSKLHRELRRVAGVSRLLALVDLARPGSYLSRVGWFETYRRGLAVDREGRPIPWFTYGAVSFLEARIRPHFRVFEYGSGNSTLWWALRVEFVAAVEHDQTWYRLMKPRLPDRVVYLLHPAEAEGEYAKAVRTFPEPFHVVVIDGRDRVHCAEHALGSLAPEGVVIWDNSDRTHYADGIALLTRAGFQRLDFEGVGPVNPNGWSTSVFYRPGNCLGL